MAQNAQKFKNFNIKFQKIGSNTPDPSSGQGPESLPKLLSNSLPHSQTCGFASDQSCGRKYKTIKIRVGQKCATRIVIPFSNHLVGKSYKDLLRSKSEYLRTILQTESYDSRTILVAHWYFNRKTGTWRKCNPRYLIRLQVNRWKQSYNREVTKLTTCR